VPLVTETQPKVITDEPARGNVKMGAKLLLLAPAKYIDGTLAGSQATSRPWAWDPAQQIEIGRSHDGFWRAYNGAMDDFRVYNRILTEAEIDQVVNAGALVDTTALKVRFNFDTAPVGISLALALRRIAMHRHIDRIVMG
jgi:hypothetical protein